MSVYSERITHRSSANFAVCGKRLLISSPLCRAWKLERRLHQMADGPAVGADRFRIALVGCAVKAGQRRLGIEGIDLAGRAVHEQEDDCLALAAKCGCVARADSHKSAMLGEGAACPRCEKSIAREQIDQRQSGKTSAHLPEELAAGASAGSRVR